MYGIRETRIAKPGRPEDVACPQCQDTGLIKTAFGDFRLCPSPGCAEEGMSDDDLSLGASV
jgi:hypothetical protein